MALKPRNIYLINFNLLPCCLVHLGLELNFTATWGDLHYLGLTGLEIVGKDGDALPLTMDMITANPRDVRSLPGHERDDRILDK